MDVVKDVVLKIQRLVISMNTKSNTETSSAAQNLFLKFPLTTKESLDQFEEDLNDDALRKEVVSVETFVKSESCVSHFFFIHC